MKIPLSNDFSDLLRAFYDAQVDFIVVGAHAMAFHGYIRATGDFDVWVRPTPENGGRVYLALVAFGAPMVGTSSADFASADLIFQIGVVPSRIDVITGIDGVSWDDAWSDAAETLYEGVPLKVLGRSSLLANKRASARPKDLIDVAELERLDP